MACPGRPGSSPRVWEKTLGQRWLNSGSTSPMLHQNSADAVGARVFSDNLAQPHDLPRSARVIVKAIQPLINFHKDCSVKLGIFRSRN